MSDNDEISELEARLDWYEERGWETAAQDTRREIAELEGDTATVKTDLTSDGKDGSGDDDTEVEELEEALQWYEERGWDGPAEHVRNQLEMERNDE